MCKLDSPLLLGTLLMERDLGITLPQSFFKSKHRDSVVRMAGTVTAARYERVDRAMNVARVMSRRSSLESESFYEPFEGGSFPTPRSVEECEQAETKGARRRPVLLRSVQEATSAFSALTSLTDGMGVAHPRPEVRSVSAAPGRVVSSNVGGSDAGAPIQPTGQIIPDMELAGQDDTNAVAEAGAMDPPTGSVGAAGPTYRPVEPGDGSPVEDADAGAAVNAAPGGQRSHQAEAQAR